MNEFLDPVALARWQFGLTTLYHFIFVPLTIGMALLVAILQTAWVRTGKDKYLRLTKLFGKVFLINFAMGVVTGIVQEFQFGMNWSNYSRFVGDIFGAPLAMEGLIAFFFEATFIGLWIFGWDKLPKKIHLMTIWFTWIGTVLSAYFILAANAFMQNPEGFVLNEERGRAELESIGDVLLNPVALTQFPHTIFASLMFAGVVLVSVAAWHLKRGQFVDEMRTTLRFGAWTNIISFLAVGLSGHSLGLVMTETQPMKMAAAEAMYNTSSGRDASFSLFSLGTPDGAHEIFSVRIPYLASFLATNSLDGTVEGINDLQAEYTELYCGGADSLLTCPTDGSFVPIVWVTYWAFRWMIGLGALAALVSVVGLWLTRKDNFKLPKWTWTVAIWTAPLPMLASLVGWVFTEMGRQPWIVFGVMTTEQGISPGVPGWAVLVSLAAFTIVYGALAVVEFGLIVKAVKAGPPEIARTDDGDGTDGSGTVDKNQLATVY
ncbi:Cytochrome bd ubiquinol oxidase subunit 1 [Leucobacter aridicollis]|uniref:Cytochrome d ubiquinol oxidase subunit I n=1 Tax=Leucobacter aridicollis TaxID=283878 RepID=A0A852R2T2_9MICO|nr:cytochrome ubiquinol oxidase subunit I [Leucobacter aridicollis]MBL3681977.1 cytochrome ubiquinol oxidase subunit I [Leucobacter aridicollis]MCS3428200.1 cytochrome d ubiquinol oxidase subunit I [Leucobacter aridicollis]NYD26977.1 cytochrome d ubiquinol oxidase subunit I [Leucobacter aridicollis]RKQ94512.1 cytochrome d ubiquinol oxidase subunit I [Mycolicibacterium mucogenicum 261Sha1.1M5]